MTSPDLTAVLDDLLWRDLIALSTDLGALRDAMAAGPITYYCGFDPTAPSLHHGHLVQLLTLRRLQLGGHRPIAVVGGATGLIGDPKPTSERQLNETEVVAGWVERIRHQIQPFLDFDGPNGAVVVNNLDWTAPLSAIEFLRDIGKHFRVNRMLAKEAVAARLESEAGISFTEFSYQILQGNDFLQLYRRHGCVLQTGGSDQWGNLTAGTDLIRRADGAVVHAFATPLLTKADGTKFGKTEGGALWLDASMTSPYAFYQFWLNTDDRDVPSYLKTLSFRSHVEIEQLTAATAERPQARAAQRALAEELTALVHGRDELARVQAASAALFGGGALDELDEPTLAAALAEAPSVSVSEEAPSLIDLLAEALAISKSDARRAVREGGAYLNNAKIIDEHAVPTSGDWLHGRFLVLRRGKRSVAVVERSR
ncbi:MAG: tyrS [Frankiales bacterium]|nr:tyrS [Frankiales bacterium]